MPVNAELRQTASSLSPHVTTSDDLGLCRQPGRGGRGGRAAGAGWTRWRGGRGGVDSGHGGHRAGRWTVDTWTRRAIPSRRPVTTRGAGLHRPAVLSCPVLSCPVLGDRSWCAPTLNAASCRLSGGSRAADARRLPLLSKQLS